MSAELIARLENLREEREYWDPNQTGWVTVVQWATEADAAMRDAIAALRAERGAEGWQPLDPDNLPKRKMLLTNNLKARDAFGQMSHVWIGTPFKADNPERDGAIVTFDEDMVRVSNLTHAHELPLPPPPAASSQDSDAKLNRGTCPICGSDICSGIHTKGR